MLNIKSKLGLYLLIFTIFTLPTSNIFANENTQTDSHTNSSTHNTDENLKPYAPPPKEPKKDKITSKSKQKFVLKTQQPTPPTSEHSTETPNNNPEPEPEQKPAETPQKSQPKESKKQEETVPAEGDSGILEGKAQPEEQKSEKNNIISEIDLPEVDDSDIETNTSFVQYLATSNKQDILKACISFILVLSGLFIIIKVIIANFKIPRGYQPSTKNKHSYSKRKKYNYNIKR